MDIKAITIAWIVAISVACILSIILGKFTRNWTRAFLVSLLWSVTITPCYDLWVFDPWWYPLCPAIAQLQPVFETDPLLFFPWFFISRPVPPLVVFLLVLGGFKLFFVGVGRNMRQPTLLRSSEQKEQQQL
jgi:hypothetical protein